MVTAAGEVEVRRAYYPRSRPAVVDTPAQKHLFLGEVFRIIYALQHAGLDELSHYFAIHQRRMHYQQFREDGYPIGSGSVESEIKQFKARLTGPGIRWLRPAERLFILRGLFWMAPSRPYGLRLLDPLP